MVCSAAEEVKEPSGRTGSGLCCEGTQSRDKGQIHCSVKQHKSSLGAEWPLGQLSGELSYLWPSSMCSDLNLQVNLNLLKLSSQQVKGN